MKSYFLKKSGQRQGEILEKTSPKAGAYTGGEREGINSSENDLYVSKGSGNTDAGRETQGYRFLSIRGRML